MGSDNPKGATARASLRARYGGYAAWATIGCVLLFCLSTAPAIDPNQVPQRGGGGGSPRRAGAEAGRAGALATMRGVQSAVTAVRGALGEQTADLSGKIREARERLSAADAETIRAELGDLGGLHESGVGARREGRGRAKAAEAKARAAHAAKKRAGRDVKDAALETAPRDAALLADAAKVPKTVETSKAEEEKTSKAEEEKTSKAESSKETLDSFEIPSATGLYATSATDIDGRPLDLSFAAGKVSLVANVASE